MLRILSCPRTKAPLFSSTLTRLFSSPSPSTPATSSGIGATPKPKLVLACEQEPLPYSWAIMRWQRSVLLAKKWKAEFAKRPTEDAEDFHLKFAISDEEVAEVHKLEADLNRDYPERDILMFEHYDPDRKTSFTGFTVIFAAQVLFCLYSSYWASTIPHMSPLVNVCLFGATLGLIGAIGAFKYCSRHVQRLTWLADRSFVSLQRMTPFGPPMTLKVPIQNIALWRRRHDLAFAGEPGFNQVVIRKHAFLPFNFSQKGKYYEPRAYRLLFQFPFPTDPKHISIGFPTELPHPAKDNSEPLRVQ